MSSSPSAFPSGVRRSLSFTASVGRGEEERRLLLPSSSPTMGEAAVGIASGTVSPGSPFGDVSVVGASRGGGADAALYGWGAPPSPPVGGVDDAEKDSGGFPCGWLSFSPSSSGAAALSFHLDKGVPSAEKGAKGWW